MKTRYADLVDQTFDFPQEEFRTEDGELIYHDIPLMEIVKQYGTPMKFTFLPKISQNIRRAQRWFNVAMAKVDYEGDYHYCYCTKSSHFSFVMKEAFKNNIHIETSSAYDIDIVEALYAEGTIGLDHYVVCNGFKTDHYVDKIAGLIEMGFTNVIAVIDNYRELGLLDKAIEGKIKIGIRIASEEEPKFQFYTSRLGIGYRDIVPFYLDRIKDNSKFELVMLHFFINTGIKDTAYYWNELGKCLRVYVNLKKHCESLDTLNIGGGFPIKNSPAFEFDYEYMAEEIIYQVKQACTENNIPDPDIFTEFGSFTVGESGGRIYSILDQKRQNDRERWNMIDSSFMTTLPDSWAIEKRFIMFPINRWEDPYERVLLGGLTCDSDDYYNSEQHINGIYLPKYNPEKPLYIGFFNTGAYQDSISGFGGIQHCLIPAPKHVIIDVDENGEYSTRLFSKEQSHKSMLKILGYKNY
jgi:arginine decarboxylase